MFRSKKGQQAGLVAGIVGITIGLILVVNVYIATVKDTNTSTFTSSEVALFNILGLAAIVGLLVLTFRTFGLV